MEPEPTLLQVYRTLLDGLRNAGAEPLANEVERTVARGVVLTEQETSLYERSSVYREMNESEALAVALEFLITALEVPLMLSACGRELGGDAIEWRPERPGSEREEVVFGAESVVDQQLLRDLLSSIQVIASELGISLPEVA